ncbi:hypothetical protein FPQ18DRAFT_310212 [Pyronema domesticum]|nr:hypothetical protein FPQ18DRAFT_310212 [Pyronema domesticum]
MSGLSVNDLRMQQHMGYGGTGGSLMSNGVGDDGSMLEAPMSFNPMGMTEGPMGGLVNSQMPPGVGVPDQYASLVSNSPMGAMTGDYGNLGGGSTLTEFTKRRNWSQRILEELQDFLHVLTPDGKIVYASPSSKPLTGFEVNELLGKFIHDFIHDDDSALFLKEFHESISTGRALRLFYRFRKSDNTFAIFETHGHPHIAESVAIDPSSPQSVCKGFFMMARPYPTRNAALLDSFLEHKIENERLVRRIAELKKEEMEDTQQRSRQQQSLRSEGVSTSLGGGGSSMGNDTPLSIPQHPGQEMPPPAKPTSQLTRQNLDRMEATNVRIEGIRDKMARFDGTHIDTIEILTGLQYRDGERSKGISTGDTSPALIRGDVGVPIPLDKDQRQTDKKKKQKIADEYVCTDCGTLDSPEWRKGPKGPKTLCNACGLRWAKSVRLARGADCR